MTDRARRCLAWPALGLFVFLAHVASPNAIVGDSMRVVPVAMSLLERQTISLDHYGPDGDGAGDRWGGPAPIPGYAVDDVNGRYLPSFPWTVSLFVLPVVVAVEAASAVGIGSGIEAASVTRNSDWPYQVVAMSLVVGATTVVLFEAARAGLATLDRRRRTLLAGGVALAFAFATPAWSTASRSAWQHAPSMLALSVALLVALRAERDPRWIAWLGVPLAAAYTIRPTNALPLGVLLLWAAYRHRRRAVPAFVGAGVVLAAWAFVNLRAWGSPLPPYYAGSRLEADGNLLEVLAANLVSPARGLFAFSPFLVLGVIAVVGRAAQRRLTALEVALAACVGAHWIAISTFPHWWGGDSFGPRLFSDMVPLLLVLSLPLLGKLGEPSSAARSRALATVALAALVGWSVFVHAQGAMFRSSYCWNDQPAEIDTNPGRVWSIRDPQLLRGARSYVFGPGHSEELVRGGVAATGCPF